MSTDIESFIGKHQRLSISEHDDSRRPTRGKNINYIEVSGTASFAQGQDALNVLTSFPTRTALMSI